MINTDISKKLIKFIKRAEKVDPELLVESFVDIGPLFTVLDTHDNQVFYGRRGTGKTHALYYLLDNVKKNQNIPIYVDMRNIGSTGGIYADPSLPLHERGTRLLIDTLNYINDGLIEEALKNEYSVNLGVVGPILDQLQNAISQIMIVGTVEEESQDKNSFNNSTNSKTALGMSHDNISLQMSDENNESHSEETSRNTKRTGQEIHRVRFGEIGSILRKLISSLEGKQLWLLLDEWSAVPLDLQPYLADLLRRTLFPIPEIVVKIAAIEKRSLFQVKLDSSDYIGIQLGSDASADLSLDDYMVFDNDEDKAVDFYKQLLFKHYKTLYEDEAELPISDEDTFIKEVFLRKDVFKEFVRASEGIPRDAFNILSISAQKNFGVQLDMNSIRIASKTWYQRDKESAVNANEKSVQLLHWIIDEVIGHRRARAFLLERNIKHPLIDDLFDSRVIHLLKKNVSAHDTPGSRYDVYKIDYGCYVDLLSTAKSPLGLFPLDDTDVAYTEVPEDDYRSIRRAILDINEFENKRG